VIIPNDKLFSVVDEVAELLRLRYISPMPEDRLFEGEFIPLCDRENHLVKTVFRADTTFTQHLGDLGRELYPYLNRVEQAHVFSVPLVAANRTIALITLGFDELDSFSQAKLSTVYLLRDQLAQLVWNLILQERLHNQPQLDNLTSLMTYSSFCQTLAKEVRRCRMETLPLSLVLLDINNLSDYNARYSHSMGDRALAHIAAIIRRTIRGVDTAARVGNDELAILLPECDASDAAIIAQRIVDTVRIPNKGIQPFTVTVGIAASPTDATDPDALLQLAHNAMSLGKSPQTNPDVSAVCMAHDLGRASDQERLDIMMAQITKKYGESGSGLFDILMGRVENRATLSSDHLMLETVASLAGAMEAKDRYTRGH
jgi:diguanylate cyclase (GGDEF)-like protein